MDLGDIATVRRFVQAATCAGVQPVLTIIDTLARAANYDENRDGSKVVRCCDYLREHLGGAIVLVTHPSEGNADRPRGGNQIEGAADAVLKLAEAENGSLTLSMTKNRYGVATKKIATYRLVTSHHGVTLELIGSNAKALSNRDQLALEALKSAGPATHGEWKKRVLELGLSEGQFNTAIKTLAERQCVRHHHPGRKYEVV